MTADRVTQAAAPTSDEGAGRLARERIREVGMPVLETDPTLASYLADGETVAARRQEAALGRIDQATGAVAQATGTLYLTNRRLLHIGDEVFSVPLGDLLELAMTEDRILVTLAGGGGVTLDVTDPREFRALIAAAKNAARG